MFRAEKTMFRPQATSARLLGFLGKIMYGLCPQRVQLGLVLQVKKIVLRSLAKQFGEMSGKAIWAAGFGLLWDSAVQWGGGVPLYKFACFRSGSAPFEWRKRSPSLPQHLS